VRGELLAPNVKNATEAALALRESGLMELHRLAIAVVALLLAATMVVAAGRIASGDGGSSSVQTPRSAPRSDEAPIVRLGTPRESGATPPPLLSQPTPPASVTPRARQDRQSQESNAPDSVSGGAG
jgi:hypothetical protein